MSGVMALILKFPSKQERSSANARRVHQPTRRPTGRTGRKPVAPLSSKLIQVRPAEARARTQARFSRFGDTSHKMPQATAERIASRMLAMSGVQAIWDLHLAASAAHGLGRDDVAESLIMMAEAAEH